MIKIGHARSSETKSKNGVAGDQTKEEVSITDFYTADWLYVFRPKSNDIAETIAHFVERCCLNDKIGYSQNSRYTLFYQIRKGIEPDHITEYCDCDCSSLVMCALYYCHLASYMYMHTGIEKECIEATGAFQTIDYKTFSDPEYLRRGDILLKSGHTAVVLTNGTKCKEVKKMITKSEVDCQYKEAKYNTPFYCVESCNMREYPSLDGAIMCVLPKGHKVRCYGYYNIDSRNVHWLYVETELNGITYQGFVSKKVLI